jgi:hypothetical protein
MTLALAHETAPAFNTGFYAAAATIIPVLFLALTLQGTAYQQLKALKAETAPYFAGVVIGAGLAGEILAIVALYRQAVWYETASGVLIATIILMAAVAAAAFLVLVTPDGKADLPSHRRPL